MEALAREIFRRTGHYLPDSTNMADTPVIDMTLTAVFAPGVSDVGGGEDVAKALQIATEAAGTKWVVNGATAKYTIIILTGALLQSPARASQVYLFNILPAPPP